VSHFIPTGPAWLQPIVHAIRDYEIDGVVLAAHLKSPEDLRAFFREELECNVTRFSAQRLRNWLLEAAGDDAPAPAPPPPPPPPAPVDDGVKPNIVLKGRLSFDEAQNQWVLEGTWAMSEAAFAYVSLL
jgi:hypothetical protein